MKNLQVETAEKTDDGVAMFISFCSSVGADINPWHQSVPVKCSAEVGARREGLQRLLTHTGDVNISPGALR